MTVDAVRRARLVDRFGPSAGPWCDALPALLADLVQRWDLVVGASLAGGTSASWRCTAGGRPAVLKVCPDVGIVADEAAALTAWRASPQVVDLLDADLAAGALLLAELPAPLGAPTLPEIGGLLVALREHGPLPVLPPLAERVEFVVELARRRGGVADALLLRGRALARELAVGGPQGLVHGDLHPANVLRRAPGGPLVAFDPRPCVGDPATDAVDFVLLDIASPADARGRAERLADLVPGLDADRALAWARSFAALVAASSLRRCGPDRTTAALLALAP